MWLSNVGRKKSQETAASNFCDRKLTSRYFTVWRLAVWNPNRLKASNAAIVNTHRILRRYLIAWLMITRLEKCTHISESRIHSMKAKIGRFIQQSMVPFTLSQPEPVSTLPTLNSCRVDSDVDKQEEGPSPTNRLSESLMPHQAKGTFFAASLMNETQVKDPKRGQLEVAGKGRRFDGRSVVKLGQGEKKGSSIDSFQPKLRSSTCQNKEGARGRSDKSSKIVLKLQEMEENRIRHLQESNARREQIRLAKLARLREVTDRAQKEIEEENRKRAQEAKERRLRKAEHQKRTEALMAKEKADAAKSDNFRRYLRLKYHGFFPWMRYMQQFRDNVVRACQSNLLRLQRAPFQAWLKVTRWNSTRKHAIASASYFRMLSRKVLSNFMQAVKLRQLAMLNASNFYDQSLLKKYMQNWIVHYKQVEEENSVKSKMAVNHFSRTIQHRCFLQMLQYVSISKADRERERRLANLRLKVLQIVPDFQPCVPVE
uniref:Homeobox protein antennapedia type n=2 Tax=Echinococcus granulosus TaxID=6210 RepID=A0A068WHN6_ECHGR|nr:Homeobox protein antennapedia type [Echinococcus granulosus]